ncbi:(Fe-S)-binding protein [Candidatus Magnetominusculus xianensis]|uniref:Glycolate oxidase iron-sulfur subunit n=1 Tax=Candidatus Magnetominusculus xianensis TaxID=1748249 RepID=A0ABR5SH87_9BACT|nr:(Fe-S)-binding protein [Candidatus Magnetominusculus xianensis]KWT91040.1 Fe-S oxidoreductase [Candidatus Magnetominusculus xianensis]MBF0402567.1 (Fe-S)-binding protein [Nitrospirota bacterium]
MKDNEFKRLIDLCVKCGGCKTQCPTYFACKEESETARGRVRLLHALVEGKAKPTKRFNEKLRSCVLCGSCANYCPLNIDLMEVFYHARTLIKDHDTTMSFAGFLSKLAFKNTDLTVNLIKPFQKLINNKLSKRKLIPANVRFTENQFKKTGIFMVKNKIGRVAIFTGCTIKHVYPELMFSAARVFNALRYEVVFPTTEVCCGAPFRSLGMESTAESYAQKNYETFSKLKVDAIISLCPTCIVALKKHYPVLINKELENVYDISDFLRGKIDMDMIDSSGSQRRKTVNLKAVFHESCHQRNELKNGHRTKELINTLRREQQDSADPFDIELLEPDKQSCCGFGGTFSVFFNDMSNYILNDTVKELDKTKAEAVITTCPNCIFQLSKAIQDKPIYHLIEIIEEAITPQV